MQCNAYLVIFAESEDVGIVADGVNHKADNGLGRDPARAAGGPGARVAAPAQDPPKVAEEPAEIAARLQGVDGHHPLEVAHLDDEDVAERVGEGEVGLVEVDRVIGGGQVRRGRRPRRLEDVAVLLRHHDVCLGEDGRRRGRGRRGGLAELFPQPLR